MKNIEDMTLEELKALEFQQDNSNDLYKVKARVANLARNGTLSLTPVGEMLVNSYVHVLLDLYGFAESITDENVKIQLINKIRSHEDMPGKLIKLTGVKKK